MGHRGSKNMRFDTTIRQGNPNFGPRLQLYARHGYHLAIFPDGKVEGVREETNVHTILEMRSAGFGQVRILGLESNLYLAMNRDGNLYGEPKESEIATIFLERLYNDYNIYLSFKWAHMGWFVAIKKNGKQKPGKWTRHGQNSTMFLPRRIPPPETRV